MEERRREMATRKKATSGSEIVVPKLDTETIQVKIKGDANSRLVVHNWSNKAIREMLQKMMGVKLGTKTPKSPEDDVQASRYVSEDGWDGFPCTGFKDSMVRAAKQVGIDMIMARQMFYVLRDGQECRQVAVPIPDQDSITHTVQTDLVKIKAKYEPRMDMVRVGMGTADVRFRADYGPDWTATLTIRRTSMITNEQVVNLVMRAGATVGVGEGRPEKCSMGWGLFVLA